MKNIKTLGIDLAKNVFQLHGVNKMGKRVLTKKVTRAKLAELQKELPKGSRSRQVPSETGRPLRTTRNPRGARKQEYSSLLQSSAPAFINERLNRNQGRLFGWRIAFQVSHQVQVKGLLPHSVTEHAKIRGEEAAAQIAKYIVAVWELLGRSVDSDDVATVRIGDGLSIR